MRLRDVADWLRLFLPDSPKRPFEVSLANGTARESRSRDQLVRLLGQYDLGRWQYTSRVRIEEQVRPHSHPVLTLNARYPERDDLALATYLHEQAHWGVLRNRRALRRALHEIEARYPAPPVEPPAGAGSRRSSHLHYLVCYIEYDALSDVLGERAARQILEEWCSDHYTEIYAAVLRDAQVIGDIVARHGLIA